MLNAVYLVKYTQLKATLRYHLSEEILLLEEERAAVMKKFPKPKCDALVALQLEQVKEQMQQRGKHPHFRFDKSLYKVQKKSLMLLGL